MNAPGPPTGGDDRPPWRRLKPIQVGFVVALFAFVLWRHPFDDRAEPPAENNANVLTLRGQALGTAWTVRWLSPVGRKGGAPATASASAAASAPKTPDIQRAIEASIDRVDALMSTWKPDSELMRLNRAPRGEAFPVAAETMQVLQAAAQISAQSGGAFDVTVAPLVRAWGFGAGAKRDGETTAPSAEALAQASASVGWQKLRLDAGAKTATRAAEGLRVDLSAIAKGFAVDQVAAALQALGLRDFFVEVGGEVVARGTRGDGTPWKLGIETPAVGAIPGAAAPQRVVALADRALATSGDYRSYREVEGKRVSHTIDPRTARPIAHGLASVSVVHEDCMRADAWATALNVLGPKEGPALAEEQGLAALFLVRNHSGTFDVVETSAFAEIAGKAGQRAGSSPHSPAAPPGTTRR